MGHLEDVGDAQGLKHIEIPLRGNRPNEESRSNARRNLSGRGGGAVLILAGGR